MKKYKELVKVIQKACPELLINKNAQLITWERKVEYFKQYAPITIGHVLRAMKEKLVCFARIPSINATNSGYLISELWNLEHTLEWHKENQPETVEFLIKLLVK